MPFQIIRNDITKVTADVIVNTANPHPVIGNGTDSAIYQAAGEAELERHEFAFVEIADLRRTGGEIVARMSILAEGGAADRKDIIYLEKLPLFDGKGNPIS